MCLKKRKNKAAGSFWTRPPFSSQHSSSILKTSFLFLRDSIFELKVFKWLLKSWYQFEARCQQQSSKCALCFQLETSERLVINDLLIFWVLPLPSTTWKTDLEVPKASIKLAEKLRVGGNSKIEFGFIFVGSC